MAAIEQEAGSSGPFDSISQQAAALPEQVEKLRQLCPDLDDKAGLWTFEAGLGTCSSHEPVAGVSKARSCYPACQRLVKATGSTLLSCRICRLLRHQSLPG